MATIISQSRELSKIERYKLVEDDTSISVTKAVDQLLSPVVWVEYSDTNAEGKIVDVLAFMTDDGIVYSTISDTFKRHFRKIAEVMDGEPFVIRVISGTSRNGRTFASCALV